MCELVCPCSSDLLPADTSFVLCTFSCPMTRCYCCCSNRLLPSFPMALHCRCLELLELQNFSQSVKLVQVPFSEQPWSLSLDNHVSPTHMLFHHFGSCCGISGSSLWATGPAHCNWAFIISNLTGVTTRQQLGDAHTCFLTLVIDNMENNFKYWPKPLPYILPCWGNLYINTVHSV